MGSKRMVTLDLVRGSCIMGMLGVHVFRRVYDLSWLGTDAMGDRSLLHLLTLLTIAYIGGMAGLFLLVSTISHTLSIREQLKAGRPLNGTIARQLMSGVLLLVFAFVVESTLGQHGFLGRMAYTPLVGETSFTTALMENASLVLYRGFHFMTLHTIAWSVIVNSAVQWFLFRNGGAEKVSRNVKVYIGLTIAVLVLTPFMWAFASWVVPGYPFATYPGTDRMVQYPLEGVSTVFDYAVLFLLGPLAGQTEPLFPFLFISFIGAIIGIYLSMDRPPKHLPNKGMMIGAVMTLTGVLGIACMLFLGLDSVGTIMEDPYVILRLNIWMPLLLLTTGGQLVFLMLLLRIIEYRDMAAKVAERTVVIRRFAIVSLTVYTFQYIDAVPLHLVSHLPGVSVFNGKDSFFWAIMAIVAVLAFWNLLLKMWEKKDFICSVEWAFSVFLRQLNHAARSDRSKRPDIKWYLAPRLNVLSADERIEWMELRPKNLIGADRERDSRLSFYLALLGLVLFPFSFLAFYIARAARSYEGPNRFNDISLKLSKLGVGWASVATFYLSQAKGFVLG